MTEIWNSKVFENKFSIMVEDRICEFSYLSIKTLVFTYK
jgi:hypothetical protein